MSEQEPLSLEEQLNMQSTIVRISYQIIQDLSKEKSAEARDELKNWVNAINMQQKELTNIQRVLIAKGKGRKSRTVTDLTAQQTATSTDDAPT